MRFVWFMLFFSTIALPGLADIPEPSEPYVTTSASRRCFLILLPGRWERGQFVQEPFGAAYKLQADGQFLELWRTEGWYSFYDCFLSDDGRYLVVVIRSPGGNKISKGDLAVAFYDRGKLLRQFSPADLVKDERKVLVSASHYRWLAEPDAELSELPVLGFSNADNEFRLTTVDGIAYSFDVTKGDIISTERSLSSNWQSLPHCYIAASVGVVIGGLVTFFWMSWRR